MIPPDFIDQILARTDIVEIIDSRVKLKKSGLNYTGLCPFHNEKTASFSVSAEKQFYYCFGCHATGSALKFLVEFDRMDFVGAVEMLASKLGMEVPRGDDVKSTEKQRQVKSIYSVLDQSSIFFRQQLRRHASKKMAVDYLESRGLSGEIARDFDLGFAPPGWDNLYTSLAKTNHERQLLIDSGMVVEKSGEGADKERVYDRFRERIMFPIKDLRGRVIAFGGRIIGDGKPRYLNSPETPVFHKGRELYGLYEARRRNRKLQQLLVVEGYMDVVALAQNEINYSVATLGTATTSDHLERLFRMVPTIIFCFDGDSAGRNAAWKALLIALSQMKDGRNTRFMFVPDGEDPDSLVRKEGRDKFEWRLDQAQHLSDFFFAKLKTETDIESLDGKARFTSVAMPLIMKIPEGVYRDLMIERLSEVTGLTTEKILLHAGAVHAGQTRRKFAAEASPQDTEDHSSAEYDDQYQDYYLDPPDREPSELAKKAISMLLRQPELAHRFPENEYAFLESTAGCTLFLEIVRTILVEEIRAPVMLIAKYQGSVEFTQLKYLAEQEHLLGVADLPEEYSGVVGSLMRRHEHESDLERERRLLAKPLQELSASEKQQLRELNLRKKSRQD